MSVDETDTTSSVMPSFIEEDIRTSEEYEKVQKLELEKQHLELQIQQLEKTIATDRNENFSRDQLATVKSELERNCSELFEQRTNSLSLKLKEAKSEKEFLEKEAERLEKALRKEQKLTQQLAQERSQQRPQIVPQFPELTLPDLSLLKDSYTLSHKKQALEEEVREAEQQLAARRQEIVQNEAKLDKVIRDSKTTTAECEAQIRAERRDWMELTETKKALKERIEANRHKQKQLEAEKRMLAAQIESSEAAQRAKIDEINRNFLAAQREFEKQRARKKDEIRRLTKQLQENEELNRAKLQEKEQLIQEMNSIYQQQQQQVLPKPKPTPKPKPKPKPVIQNQVQQQTFSPDILQLQNEIEQLQSTKMELMNKIQDVQRKASSNEQKLETAKRKLERKVADSERQIRRLKAIQNNPQDGDLPPTLSDSSSM